MVLQVQVSQLEETEDFRWDDEALLLDEGVEWGTALSEAFFEKGFKESHVQGADCRGDNLDVL